MSNRQTDTGIGGNVFRYVDGAVFIDWDAGYRELTEQMAGKAAQKAMDVFIGQSSWPRGL